MPGVPSGRGCDACRKQRKKCDQNRPTCSRCKRLNITCVGAGQQRFKWHVVQSSDKVVIATGGQETQDQSQTCQVLMNRVTTSQSCISVLVSPSDKYGVLADGLVRTILPSTGVQYNMLWVFGEFLQHIPRRLGTNQALDAAVAAVSSAHAEVCLHFGDHWNGVSTRTLRLYGNAIKAMRAVVSCDATASSPETLCAMYLLLISQSLIKEQWWTFTRESAWSSHNIGALQLLRRKGPHHRTGSEFENTLLHALRGAVLFESLFNPSVNLTNREWRNIADCDLEGDPEPQYGDVWRKIAKIPDLLAWLRKSRNLKTNSAALQVIKTQALEEYHESLRMAKTTLGQLMAYEESCPNGVAVTSPTHLQQLRAHGASLISALLWICVLKSTESPDSASLWDQDATSHALQMLDLGAQTRPYRPVGALHMDICLMFAYAAVDDINTRLMIMAAFDEIRACSPWINPLTNHDFDSIVSVLRLW